MERAAQDDASSANETGNETKTDDESVRTAGAARKKRKMVHTDKSHDGMTEEDEEVLDEIEKEKRLKARNHYQSYHSGGASASQRNEWFDSSKDVLADQMEQIRRRQNSGSGAKGRKNSGGVDSEPKYLPQAHNFQVSG